MAHPSFLFLSLQPLNLEHYEAIRSMASEIQAYAPDARIMTTYYCGEYFPLNLKILILTSMCVYLNMMLNLLEK